MVFPGVQGLFVCCFLVGFFCYIISFKIEFVFVCNKEEVSVEVLKTYIQVSLQNSILFSLRLDIKEEKVRVKVTWWKELVLS